MRPIILELDGFCSYRTKAKVDFRDADFFVLVGSTGSGKSTVIDAMLFALYGTVPRWGERNAVAPALAPTVSRGVVRLIFDAGGKRYVAARDIRRVGRASPTVREARIERFVSADATGEPEDETVAIATGRGVNVAVEGILGLTFEQFTQSVALPQGEFAKFLHATDAERQSILKNLLGYTIYESIQSAAHARASNAESKAATLTEQLQNYADATQEKVESLTRLVTTLNEFQSQVTEVAVPALKQTMSEAATARGLAGKAASECQQLSGVERPEGIEELLTEHADRDKAVTSAQAHQESIEQQDNEIRGQLNASIPRHQLEQILANRQELSAIDAQLPTSAEQESTASREQKSAEENCSNADVAVRSARETAATATRWAEEQAQRLQTTRERLAALQSLTPPADLQDIADGLLAANAAVVQAKSELVTQEEERGSAVTALNGLPDSAVLVAANSEIDRMLSAITQVTAQAMDLEAAQAARDEAQSTVDAATQQVAASEQTLRDAEHAHQAAALRADLQVGDDCPVCGAEIAELTGDRVPADLNDARDQLKTAKKNEKTVEAAAAQKRSLHEQLVTVRTERLRQCDESRLQLLDRLSTLGIACPDALDERVAPDVPAAQLESACAHAVSVRGQLTKLTSQRSAAAQRRQDADDAVNAGRRTVEIALKALEDSKDRSLQAVAALQSARDSVSALSPPQFDATDISAAWGELTVWAGEQASELSGQIDSLTISAREAQSTAEQTGQALSDAEAVANDANRKLRDAALTQQRASAELRTAQTRFEELTVALTDAPTSAEATDQLDVVKGLEEQLRDVGAKLLAARAASTEARAASTKAKEAVDASWQHMRRVRDSLAALGAPEVSGVDLLSEWQLLLDWATTEATARASTVETQGRLATEVDRRTDDAARALCDGFGTHGIDGASGLGAAELVDRAAVLVSSAVATARGKLERAEERRSESESMQTELTEARETAEVARMLSTLMRANNFPRWLIGGALDTLLQDASAILLDLSGGQFELTRDERDLLVIDHNDADMTRPVKTLSGGETFQASLSLALALSEQVTALSAAGASRLESIFLDEGFGTLDDTTLDVVASTLESLASSGSRMVGVITHVAALAERIPVRYQVNRDTAGSHIERLQV